MAVPFRIFARQCRVKFARPIKCNFYRIYEPKIETCSIFPNICTVSAFQSEKERTATVSWRRYTTQSDTPNVTPEKPTETKPTLFKKFKQMARDYWYVLLPVHGITSLIWFGGFYYTVRSGVDVLAFLQGMGISDSILEPLRNSGAGYYALAFACYKVATPLRYTVTLGATTFAIQRLTTLGWIKPIPSKEKIKEVLQEQKENLQQSTEKFKEAIQEKKDNLQDKFIDSKHQIQAQIKEKQAQMKEKKFSVIEEINRYKSEMRSVKDKVKKM